MQPTQTISINGFKVHHLFINQNLCLEVTKTHAFLKIPNFPNSQNVNLYPTGLQKCHPLKMNKPNAQSAFSTTKSTSKNSTYPQQHYASNNLNKKILLWVVQTQRKSFLQKRIQQITKEEISSQRLSHMRQAFNKLNQRLLIQTLNNSSQIYQHLNTIIIMAPFNNCILLLKCH